MNTSPADTAEVLKDAPRGTPRPSAGGVGVGYRNVLAIVGALTLMQAAVGALSVVGPLALGAAGASTTAIGGVVAAYAFGFLLGARIAPQQIGRIGHIRSIALFAAIASIGGAALSFSTAIPWWMAAQFAIGASVAGLLAAGEAWVADAAPPEHRGAVLGFYLVASKAGVIAGPFLVAPLGPGAAHGFVLVAALFTACLLPVATTRRAEPAPPAAEPFGPLKLWRTTPSAVIAAFVAGAVNGAVLQLYAVFAGDLNPSDPAAAAALFNAVIIGGSVLAQWPAGLISDRVDRRLVIASLAIISAFGAAGLAVLTTDSARWLVYACAGVWGAGSLSYYGVAVAHAADRALPGQATSMMSGILMIWGAGAIVGPLIAGALMDSPLGPPGLFAFAAAALLALAAGMAYRRVDKVQVDEGDKGAFAPAPATSVSIVELTPMGESDDPQLDLFEPTHTDTEMSP